MMAGAHPDASQTVNFQPITSTKQGYSLPVVPTGYGALYRLSSVERGRGVPPEWIVEFSDLVMANGYGEEFIQIDLRGQYCGPNGIVSTLYDRRYLWGIHTEEFDNGVDGNRGARRGACATSSVMPPEDFYSTATVVSTTTTVSGSAIGAVAAAECPELCTADGPCDPSSSFCHCGTRRCECLPGFHGPECSFDLCAAARCGEHGTCAARYLGGTRSSLVVLPVTSYKHTCIYNGGWYGTPFDIPDPFVTSDLICGGNVRCASDNGGVPYCECYDGYFGENCEQSCDGLC